MSRDLGNGIPVRRAALLLAALSLLTTCGGEEKHAATGEATPPAPAQGPVFEGALAPSALSFDRILPADGATVHGSEAYVSWPAPERADGRVLYRPAGSTAAWQDVEAAPAERAGDPLVAHLTGLVPGTLDYVVEHTAGGLAERSRMRTLVVVPGPSLALDPETIEATVSRDYAVRVDLPLVNQTSRGVRVAARVGAAFADLPADVVGPGSADDPIDLAPGARTTLALSVTAVDARHGGYTLPITSGGVLGVVRLHVRNPKLALAAHVVAADPRTLAETVEIENQGDLVADLDVRVAPPNQDEARIDPAVTHAWLPEKETLQITVSPVLYLEFRSLSLDLLCRAAGQEARFPLTFQAPEGKRLLGVRHSSTEADKAHSHYCTNAPDTCSPVPAAAGNGATGKPSLWSTVSSHLPFGSGKGTCDCDTPDACDTLRSLDNLFAKYSGSDPRYQSFDDFLTSFDALLADLSNKDLACRYDDPSDPGSQQVEELLTGIRKTRHSLETAGGSAMIPSSNDCAFEVDSVFPKTADGERRCRDFHRLRQIQGLLDQLAALLGCPSDEASGGGEGFDPCPELGSMDEIKEKLEWGEKASDVAASAAKDEKVKSALEKASKLLGFLTRNLGRVLKGQKYCRMLEDLLNALQKLDDARTPEENAKAFDDVFHQLFRWGGEFFPWPFDTYCQDLQDETLFSDMEKKLAPQERWKGRFPGVLDDAPKGGGK